MASNNKLSQQEIENSTFDSTTNSNKVQIVDASGTQITSFGSSFTDEGTFTEASTSVTPVAGYYKSTADTLTTGKAAAVAIDANRNMQVTQATLIAGENLTTNRMEVSPRYSYSAVATADVQVKASAGLLHSVTISCNDAAPTAGSLIIYDNTAESGTQVFNHTFTTTPFAPFTVILDYTMATGIYLGFTTTADVNVSVAYI